MIRNPPTSTGLPLEVPGVLDPVMLEQVARPVRVVLADSVLQEVSRCHRFVLECLEGSRAVYGASTGFGPLVSFPGRDTDEDQCDNVLQHLTAGQGPDLPPRVARAAVLARLWSLSRGYSGVSLRVLEALAAMLDSEFAPAVPRLGSVGASGDLVPLAHVAQGLAGRGHAYLGDRRVAAADALERSGLVPLVLDGRDALALVNGTSLTSAAAGLALAKIDRSHRVSAMLTALLCDVLGCAPVFLDASLLRALGHTGAMRAGRFMRELLAGIEASGTRPLQEPYSLRCGPQLIGAAGTVIGQAEQVIVDDLNGVSDNPLFFAEQDLVVHGGNFFGQPVAFAADMLSLATTQLGNLAERQLDLMVDPHRNSGLPPMLSPEPGKQHGVQGVQVVATSLVMAMRRAATPASSQSLPTNLHNQDVVPAGTQAALNALDQAETLRLLHGCLAVTMRQALHVGGRTPTAPACVAIADQLVEHIAPIDPDRPLDEDVRRVADLLDQLAEERKDAR
jgi:histidine ammonia-lyase/tyrosine ammonia-lyase